MRDDKTMKLIIIGGTGLLGQALKKEAVRRKIQTITVARKNADRCLDITNDKELTAFLIQEKPDTVINACAIVNHKICEENPSLAYCVNARPNSVLAGLSRQCGFKFVYISTDGYFHGDARKKHDEKSPVRLLNEYARTKYLGEKLTELNPDALIVRTNIVGFRGNAEQPSFAEWAINALKNKEKMTLFDDYYTSSISVAQFSKALFDLLEHNVSGLINLASREVSSKKEFIETLADVFGLSAENATTGSVSRLSSSCRADSLGLDVSRAEEILGYTLPDLHDVIFQLKKEYTNEQ